MAKRDGLSAGRLGLAAMLWASTSWAEPPQLTLEWSAPSTCPTEQDVLAVVTAHLGAAPESVLARPLVARVEVTQQERWVLDLEWKGGDASEHRRIEANSCTELARAAALLIALAVDPTQSSAPEADAPRPLAPPSPPRARATSPPEVARRSAPQPRRPADRAPPTPPRALGNRTAVFIASGGIELGSLPGLAPGAVAGLGAALHGFELQADVGVFGSSEQTAEGPGGRFWEFSLALRPCARLERKPLGLSPCLSAEVVGLSAEGLGMSHTLGQWIGLLRLGGGARASLRLTQSVGLAVDGWLQVPLRRPEFVADGAPLFEPEITNLRASLGFWHVLSR